MKRSLHQVGPSGPAPPYETSEEGEFVSHKVVTDPLRQGLTGAFTGFGSGPPNRSTDSDSQESLSRRPPTAPRTAPSLSSSLIVSRTPSSPLDPFSSSYSTGAAQPPSGGGGSTGAAPQPQSISHKGTYDIPTTITDLKQQSVQGSALRHKSPKPLYQMS
jgi:hypothetical protein